MKNQHHPSRSPGADRSRRGFAIIVTVTIMVLLALIAVGLLSLSTITVRASQTTAMSVARATARLALVLALGELQKAMGPDKAISAPSEIIDAYPAKANLTGVWESWDVRPDAPAPNYDNEKRDRFQRWLVSDPEPGATAALDYASQPFSEEPVELVGKASLGGLDDDSLKVHGGRVPVMNGSVRTGSFAWHVADEAVKARINSYRDPSRNETLAKKSALLTGHRPDPSVVQAVDQTPLSFLPVDDTKAAYGEALATSARLLDLNQADLLANSSRIGKFRNVVTPYSLGVMSDVRGGGLKKDLTSMFEGRSLPPAYAGRKLYESTHGVTGVSDPNWSALASYYDVYRKITNPDISPIYEEGPEYPVDIKDSEIAPVGFYPAPVIAKIEVLFTFVTRDAHWSSPKTPRMGHLVYVPLITLHNPYNMSISFDRVQVVIRSIPVAFNFIVNGKPQLTDITALSELHLNNGRVDVRGEKSFALDIGNWSRPGNSTTRGPIVMKPGQTLVSGPYLFPNTTFSVAGRIGPQFDDWANDATGVDLNGNVVAMIQGRPGFLGKAVGFDIDILTPLEQSTSVEDSSDGGVAVLGLRPTDTVAIEFGIRQPTKGMKDRFQVSAAIVTDDKVVQFGGLDFYYGDSGVLGKHFGQTQRFPKQGSFLADEAYHSNNTPLNQQGNAKAFALFSAYARTSNGGVYETNQRNEQPGALNVLRDGRLAGKPSLDHNPARSVVTVDLKRDVPGMHSHELNFVLLPGHADDVFEIDPENRNNVLTGNTTSKGLKSGTYLELPTGPMLTIADFRRSNALTTPFLPNSVQPVSNSRVSPLISTDQVIEANPPNYPLLDHSFLANQALYDSFYFSTLAPGKDRDLGDLVEEFLEGRAPLPSQAFQPYLPQGHTIDGAKEELVADATTPAANAYRLAAEYQMVRGPFNVNSTSVEAWKAVLSCLNKSQIPIFWPKSLALTLEQPYGTPILPMSLLNGSQATAAAVNPPDIDNIRANQWNGFRELSEKEIGDLAEAIVEQVRTRGPFLSLAEFVNRQIGTNSELTRSGALQAAINKSRINDAVFVTQVPVTAADVNNPLLYKYKTIENAIGNPAEGAPGWVNQGDLMRLIGPLATVRADTFVIRTCGEATDAAGRVTARAYAEAVVQRIPDYLNPVDRPSVNASEDAAADPANKVFGRRLKIVAFRWLSNLEV